MNIYLFEVKKKIVSTLIWVASIAVFLLFFYSVYETMNNVAMDEILKQFPEAFLKAFGMQDDLSTVEGYTAMVGVYLALFGAIFSSGLGLNAVSVEERDMTADFLISKPATRVKIMTAKIAASFSHILFFAAFNAMICYVSIEIFATDVAYSAKIFWLMMLGIFILQILFFAAGLFISVIMKKMGSPNAISMGLAFGFFVLNSFDTILEDTIIRYFVPYDYFNFQQIIKDAAFRPYGLIISLVLIVVFTALSYVFYGRRNISTAM